MNCRFIRLVSFFFLPHWIFVRTSISLTLTTTEEFHLNRFTVFFSPFLAKIIAYQKTVDIDRIPCLLAWLLSWLIEYVSLAKSIMSSDLRASNSLLGLILEMSCDLTVLVVSWRSSIERSSPWALQAHPKLYFNTLWCHPYFSLLSLLPTF